MDETFMKFLCGTKKKFEQSTILTLTLPYFRYHCTVIKIYVQLATYKTIFINLITRTLIYKTDCKLHLFLHFQCIKRVCVMRKKIYQPGVHFYFTFKIYAVSEQKTMAYMKYELLGNIYEYVNSPWYVANQGYQLTET